MADTVCACADGDCAGEAFVALVERSVTLDHPTDRVALDAEHDRAADCYADRAHLTRGEQIVAAMDDLAEAVCACPDLDCAEATRNRYVQQRSGLAEPVIGRADRRAIDAAAERIVGCVAKLPGVPTGEEAARFVERMADEVCACADAACATAVEELAARGVGRFGRSQPSAEEMARIERASARAASCRRKLRGDAAPAAP
jgi:hypothetical protein